MKKLLIICLALRLFNYSSYGQNKIIKGTVINDFLERIPAALIVIDDTVKVGKTDLNGFFQIEIPVSVKQISFMFLGIEKTTIELMDKCDEVDVIVMASSSYDFISLKKVDRLRMKRFKQLPELHKKAFEKGIFKTDKVCYNQKFVPDYIKQK